MSAEYTEQQTEKAEWAYLELSESDGALKLPTSHLPLEVIGQDTYIHFWIELVDESSEDAPRLGKMFVAYILGEAPTNRDLSENEREYLAAQFDLIAQFVREGVHTLSNDNDEGLSQT